MECYASTKDFSAFVRRFPVSLDGQPPRKKQRVNEGFLEDRVFMTGGETPSMPRERNICYVSYPIYEI